ncbi:MAG: tetratricopeptide repeat protein [Pseudobdellovibrio sp.]
MKNVPILLFFTLGCLNLSHAQTGSAPVNVNPALQNIQNPNTLPNQTGATNSVPATTPSTTAPSAIPPTPPATTPQLSTGPNGQLIDPNAPQQANVSVGKYEEYLSICRSHEYDKPQYQSKEIYNTKIAEMNKTADAVMKLTGEKGIQDVFRLMHACILMDDSADFNKLAAFLKQKKLSESESATFAALNSYSKKNYREARLSFLKALAKEEKNVLYLTWLAEIYSYENNFYEASAIYEDLNRDYKNAYLAEYCESLVLNSLNADGEKACALAAKKFPDNPFPLLYIGISHRERQNLKLARDFFERANKIKQTEMGNICLAELSLLENKPEDAVRFFKESFDKSPMSQRAIVALAWTQMKVHDYDGALTSFKKACQLNGRFEIEVRKAYKKVMEEKYPGSEKFMSLSNTCANR